MLKFYIKIFLIFGIGFGICWFAFSSILSGFSVGLINGLYAGLLFGFAMAASMGTAHIFYSLHIAKGKPDNLFGVHHIRKATINVQFREAFNLCKEALKSINVNSILYEVIPDGIIYARTEASWQTFGDDVSFKIHKVDENCVEVEVSSRPRVRTTIIDYGKNLDNVQKIVGFLQEHIGQTGHVDATGPV